MLRKCALGLFVIASVVTVAVAWREDAKTAPQSISKTDVQDSVLPPNGNAKPLKPSNPLPVTQVVLFNSGVGFFQRSGEIDGEARVDLQFPASDINDLIKSLVVEDAKGKAMPLHYDSQEPIEKTLKSFALDLSSNPSLGQILNQARGEKVEITLQSNNTGLPGTMSGTIIGMETAHRLPSAASTVTAEMEFLNLKCAEGLRSVPVTQIQRLRFLNPTLENEFARALDVVAAAHDSQKKSVRLGFKGEGKREVKVGYVVENPIWKTSYRLVMGADNKPKLLGWANIENTSDEDWNNVKLTLVSSRPISFQMDLYPPLFIPRPVVEPALFASLRPQSYQGPLANFSNNLNNPGFGQQGGAGFGGGNNYAFNNTINPGLIQQQQGLGQAGQLNLGGGGGQFGFQGGQFGLQGGGGFNRYQNSIQAPQNSRLTYQELQERKNNDKNPANNNKEAQQNQQRSQQMAKHVGSILTGVDQELIEAALTAEELGNPARYVIEEKVSLPRQQSAMIPVLEQSIEASRVSIYNERVHPKNPLLGMKIKNNSKQSLMSGPISVYDDSHYVGDARIADLQPGEERFISYAIDTGTEVKPYDKVIPGPEMTVKLENGLLTVQYKLRQTRTYVLKNRSPETRKVVLEQPVRDGWSFAEARKLSQFKDKDNKDAWKTGDNEKPMERTRDLYRFAVDVKPGELVKYEVSEELPRIDPFQSTKQTDWTGFATTLGLDVWTDTQRKPEDVFTVQFVGEQLRVTHKDRRATTYFIRNRADVDRTVFLEHIVPKERKMLGDAKADVDNAQRYCLKLDLPKGATVTQHTMEELKDSKPEMFALQTVEGTPPPRPGTNDLPQQRYVTALGFEMWFVKKTLPEQLMSAKFVKGDVMTTSKQVETTAYHLRNLGDAERTFELDHLVRPNWAFVGKDKPLDGAGIKHRFTLQAAKNQVVKQEVSEERIVPKKELIDNLSEDRVKELMNSPVPSASVKEQLSKGFALRNALDQTAATLKEMRLQVKEINEEQARLRVNLDKLPAGSDLHKRYLTKLDKEETAMEKVQSQMMEKIALEKKQKKDYEEFIEKLNVE